MLSRLYSTFGKSKAEDEEEQDDNSTAESQAPKRRPFDMPSGREVLQTGFKRSELNTDIDSRQKDLKKLKSRIREKWQSYQYYLEESRDRDGIDQLEAKTKAKEAKKAAKDGEKLFKMLWKELFALRNALRKDQQMQIVTGEHYQVNLTEVDTTAVENMAEEHRETLRRREMNVEALQDGVDKMEDDEVEISFHDIEKDVAELEMQDLDITVEGGNEAEIVSSVDSDWE
jgi:hypothetical protein